MQTIRDVFDKHLKHIRLDKKFVFLFQRYLQNVLSKDEDHVAFLSNPYIGLHRITFSTGDKNYFWDSILEVDRDVIADDLHNLPNPNYKKRGANGSDNPFLVMANWKVGGDVTNHALLFLTHLALNAKGLDKKYVELFCKDVLILLQYKFLTGFLYNDYTYLARKDIVLATYEELNKRFLIKQVGSWKEYFNLRATTIYNGEKHRRDFKSFITNYNEATAIVGTLTGISSNLRDMMNAYNTIFHRIHKSDNRLSLTSGFTTNSDGEKSLVEKLNSPLRYKGYIENTIGTISELIDKDLVIVIVKNTKLRESVALDLLETINSNYKQPKNKNLDLFIDLALTYSISTLTNKGVDLTNIGTVLLALDRSLYTKKETNELNLEMKRLGNDLVEAYGVRVKERSHAVYFIVKYLTVLALLNS